MGWFRRRRAGPTREGACEERIGKHKRGCEPEVRESPAREFVCPSFTGALLMNWQLHPYRDTSVPTARSTFRGHYSETERAEGDHVQRRQALSWDECRQSRARRHKRAYTSWMVGPADDVVPSTLQDSLLAHWQLYTHHESPFVTRLWLMETQNVEKPALPCWSPSPSPSLPASFSRASTCTSASTTKHPGPGPEGRDYVWWACWAGHLALAVAAYLWVSRRAGPRYRVSLVATSARVVGTRRYVQKARWQDSPAEVLYRFMNA